MSSLTKSIIFQILQFLCEENLVQSANTLVQEHFKELIKNGEWDGAEGFLVELMVPADYIEIISDIRAHRDIEASLEGIDGNYLSEYTDVTDLLSLRKAFCNTLWRTIKPKLFVDGKIQLPHIGTTLRDLNERNRGKGIAADVPSGSGSAREPDEVSRYPNIGSLDLLPTNYFSRFKPHSSVTCMGFDPVKEDRLVVGTRLGVIWLWNLQENSKTSRIFGTNLLPVPQFAVNQSVVYMPPTMPVNQCAWAPDGSLIGVAFSENIVQIFMTTDKLLKQNLILYFEFQAHSGGVNDIAFAMSAEEKLCIVTCGDDKMIKVWDAQNGGSICVIHNDAGVYSIYPNLHLSSIFSSSIDGKIKQWLYDFEDGHYTQYDFGASGFCRTRVIPSPDTNRLFFVQKVDHGNYLAELKGAYGSLKTRDAGRLKVVHFDLQNSLLAVGVESTIRFWDIDNTNLLMTTAAGGRLTVDSLVKLSRSASQMAVTTREQGVNWVEVFRNANF